VSVVDEIAHPDSLEEAAENRSLIDDVEVLIEDVEVIEVGVVIVGVIGVVAGVVVGVGAPHQGFMPRLVAPARSMQGFVIHLKTNS